MSAIKNMYSGFKKIKVLKQNILIKILIRKNIVW